MAAVLPYYGSETFGLHGLATAAHTDGHVELGSEAVAPHWEITTISAIGKPQINGSQHARTSAPSALQARERRPANDLRWPRAEIDHR